MVEKIPAEKLGRTLIERLREEKSLIKVPKRKKIFKGKLKESAILLLSDSHFGKENHFVDMDTGKDYLTYNTEIAIQEANRLVDAVSSINQLLAPSYNIDTLHIFTLGDLVEGQDLFVNQELLIEAGVGNQMLFTVKIISDLIRELLREFQNVKMINIPGNHGRLKRRAYRSGIYYNNFDFLAGKMLQTIFEKEKRVEIRTPETFGFLTKVNGWYYWLSHGAQIRSWSGLPWYGIVRYGKSIKNELPETDIICLGHFHQNFEVPIASNLSTIVNGCWIEKDSYCWDQWKRMTVPRQTYFGVSPKRPRSWSFTLDLKPKNNPKER